ncbi:nucleotidyl transferase AbiEii/AbiGii toxin family protein [Agromyces archimandritae]|uniref:Nucleotidyl transferase AbiEii/AbiGii toxin family protein n=1 Tax=Agromyces archimandritae TaxID=2781962 RepID=A0A975FJK5_9MICO|nr:nucleotidyl transferase AbiEii/AbiGii toxin family protein [Agromyces archimandritae]
MTAPPVPARDDSAGRAFNDLRNLAKQRGREPMEYFTVYALEGFLARLTSSPFAPDFVLKGGVLMAAFASRRPTRDIDLAARGLSNDIADVEARVRKTIEIEREDRHRDRPRRAEHAVAGLRGHRRGLAEPKHRHR